MMPFRRRFYSLCTVCLLIAGCSSATGPVNVRDTQVAQPQSAPAGADSQVAVVQPVAPAKKTERIPLVEKLVTQSNQALSGSRYDQAINLAERGLRIDRKEPRFYLVLATAYRSLANKKQSVFFAQQGLRYAGTNDSTYRRLKALAK